ncbi:MAG: OB-fold domain-containing protein [Deltaproteobacteria bacterium]|nr:OB-fold domain-containing protein [Deltaproteobacteria bacterium]
MSEYKKPLPVIQPWTEAFWEAAKEHRLLVQHCKKCDVNIFYPRKFCPECWSADLGWKEAGGKAKVYSYTVTMAGVEPHFAEDLPYVLAWVDLEEGVRMLTNIVGCAPGDVRIGMDVEVAFEDVTPEISLPKFKPVE